MFQTIKNLRFLDTFSIELSCIFRPPFWTSVWEVKTEPIPENVEFNLTFHILCRKSKAKGVPLESTWIQKGGQNLPGDAKKGSDALASWSPCAFHVACCTFEVLLDIILTDFMINFNEFGYRIWNKFEAFYTFPNAILRVRF